MAAVGITENVKGDAKKFEIWYNAREEVYIIQVNNMPLKKKEKGKGVGGSLTLRRWFFRSVISLIGSDEERGGERHTPKHTRLIHKVVS